jgi:hypothetical protein
VTADRMRVAVSARGVEVDDGQGGVLAPWADVRRVTAFALGGPGGTARYVSFDLVNGHSVEVDDAAPEWVDVVAGISAHVETDVGDVAGAVGALTPEAEVLVVAHPVRPRAL